MRCISFSTASLIPPIQRAAVTIFVIYSTFPIVEREETAQWGRYCSRDLALAWINALMAVQPDADVEV